MLTNNQRSSPPPTQDECINCCCLAHRRARGGVAAERIERERCAEERRQRELRKFEGTQALRAAAIAKASTHLPRLARAGPRAAAIVAGEAEQLALDCVQRREALGTDPQVEGPLLADSPLEGAPRAGGAADAALLANDGAAPLAAARSAVSVVAATDSGGADSDAESFGE